jgi:hypothetical protein
MIGINKSVFAVGCLVLLGFSSCRTTKVVTNSSAPVKPMATSKLIRNIENNAFDYKHLTIKKLTCQFDNGKSKTSFKASILAEKDKRITVMLSKLNIPVGRLWLTPDSVKYINYLDKSYFLDDYSYLSSWLDMDIDFKTVNAIISNNILALRDDKKDPNNLDYQIRIDSGMYVLESVTMLKSKKGNQKDRLKKSAKKSKPVITDSPVQQSVYVDPETFKLRKISMKDAVNSRNLSIDFSDFTAVEKQLYPGTIDLRFASPESSIELNVRLSGFSMEEENEIHFRIPEKYTRINTE